MVDAPVDYFTKPNLDKFSVFVIISVNTFSFYFGAVINQ